MTDLFYRHSSIIRFSLLQERGQYCNSKAIYVRFLKIANVHTKLVKYHPVKATHVHLVFELTASLKYDQIYLDYTFLHQKMSLFEIVWLKTIHDSHSYKSTNKRLNENKHLEHVDKTKYVVYKSKRYWKYDFMFVWNQFWKSLDF